MEITLKKDAIWGATKSNTNWFGNTFPFLKSNRTVLSTPKIIKEKCLGIKLGIHHVRSLIFSTDIALIEHSDTDAILAVYPFAPSSKIMKGLIEFSSKGGKTIQNLQTVIASGADGIVLTPPSTGELFYPIMEEYRKGIKFWQKIMKF